MNNSSLHQSKVNNTHNNGNGKDMVNTNLVAINEKVNLTRSQDRSPENYL